MQRVRHVLLQTSKVIAVLGKDKKTNCTVMVSFSVFKLNEWYSCFFLLSLTQLLYDRLGNSDFYCHVQPSKRPITS